MKKTKNKQLWLTRDTIGAGLYGMFRRENPPVKDKNGNYILGHPITRYWPKAFRVIFPPNVRLRKGQCKKIKRVSIELE